MSAAGRDEASTSGSPARLRVAFWSLGIEVDRGEHRGKGEFVGHRDRPEPSQGLDHQGTVVGQPTLSFGTRGVDALECLVVAATAPMAVANALPSLPEPMWVQSFDAAWSAAAAVLAAYTPRTSRPFRRASRVDEVLDEALRHAGEHVTKLADTASGPTKPPVGPGLA